MKSSSLASVLALSLLVYGLLGLPSAHAAPATWFGADGIWGEADNWSTDIVPNDTATTATFGVGTNLTYTVTMDNSYTAENLNISGDFVTIALGGNTLNITTGTSSIRGNTATSGSALTFDGTGGGTVNSGVLLEGASNSNSIVTLENGLTYNYAGSSTNVVGEGENGESDNNQLIISSGTTVQAAGSRIAVGLGVNSTSTGNSVVIDGAGTTMAIAGIQLGASSTGTGLANSNSFTIQNGATVTIGNVNTGQIIVGSGNKNNSGETLTVTGAGSSLIDSDTAGTLPSLLIGSSSAGTGTGNTVMISAGGSLSIAQTTSIGSQANNALTVDGAGSTATLTGLVTNAGHINVTNGGTLTASAGIANTGTINFTAGRINIGGSATSSKGMTVGSNGGLTAATLNLTSGSTTNFGTGLTLATNGVLTGSGSAAAGTGLATGGLVTTAATSIIAPGAMGTGTGTLTLDTLNATAGSTFSYDLGASLQTESLLVSTLTGGGNLVFNFNDIGVTTGDYTLITFTNQTGLNLSQFSLGSTDGISGTFILNANNLQFDVTQVPEPGTIGLFLSAGVFLLYGLFKRRGMSSI